MKAQRHQIKGDNFIIYGFLAAIIMQVLPIFFDQMDMESMNGGLFAVSTFGMIPVSLVIVSLVLVARICGWDMDDKTINYELLSGHSRSQIYFGRVVMSLVYALVAGLMITVLPTFIVFIIKGWGNNAAFKEVFVRIAVMMCPYIRWICELVLVAFIVKSSNATLVLGFLMCEAVVLAQTIFEDATGILINVQFAMTNMIELSQITNSKMELVNGELISVFDASLKSSDITSSIVVSFVVAVLCVMAGYAIFKKRDM